MCSFRAIIFIQRRQAEFRGNCFPIPCYVRRSRRYVGRQTKKFKEMGLVAMLSLASFVVINLITFSLIENLLLSVSIVLAFAISYILTFISHVIILNNISKEYLNGTKFIASFKTGYKKSIATILDVFAPIWLGFLLTYFVAFDALYSFSYFMIISILISVFTSLLTFRWFISIYLKINNSKSKKVNFKREVVKNEEE